MEGHSSRPGLGERGPLQDTCITTTAFTDRRADSHAGRAQSRTSRCQALRTTGHSTLVACTTCTAGAAGAPALPPAGALAGGGAAAGAGAAAVRAAQGVQPSAACAAMSMRAAQRPCQPAALT